MPVLAAKFHLLHPQRPTTSWAGVSARTWLWGGLSQDKRIVVGGADISTISQVDALTVAIGRRSDLETGGLLIYG